MFIYLIINKNEYNYVSNDHSCVAVPPVKLTTVANRAFPVAGPRA